MSWEKVEPYILIPDRRFHEHEDVIVPRVTSITGMWHKGMVYDKWLGNAVSYEDAIRQRDEAARAGSKIHDLLAQCLFEKQKNGNCSLRQEDTDLSYKEWEKVVAFANFMRDWNVEPLFVEDFLYSEHYGTAGTPDMIARVTAPTVTRGKKYKLENELVVVDWKTGSAIHHGHKIQVSMYAEMFNDMEINDAEGKPLLVNNALIIRLGSGHVCGYEVQHVDQQGMRECVDKDWKACYRMFEVEHGLEKKDKKIQKDITI